METDKTFSGSTNIRRIQWDDPDMIITFMMGRRYRFRNVPASVYEAALTAPSIGKYYYANIHGKFEYEEIK